MRVTTALITGSMNPFTRGHKHVVDTGLLVFDKVVVGIGHNPGKSEGAIFSIEQRLRMASASLLEHGEPLVEAIRVLVGGLDRLHLAAREPLVGQRGERLRLQRAARADLLTSARHV